MENTLFFLIQKIKYKINSNILFTKVVVMVPKNSKLQEKCSIHKFLKII